MLVLMLPVCKHQYTSSLIKQFMHHREGRFIFLDQQGQASVFVLALLGVVLVCALFLYQSGRLTSEKMQLQNAADAAAYGASTLEARSLNFSAYTNRAMVANEVAVGQLVGLLSFADELKTTEEYAEVYVGLIESFSAFITGICAVPTLGVCVPIVEGIANTLVGFIEAIAGVLSGIGEALEAFFDVVVGPSIQALSIINMTYSISQEVYHGATYVLVAKNVYQSIADNTTGAELSDLGVIALIGHLPSYWSGYTKRYTTSKKKDKDKDKDKEKDKDKDKKEEEENKGMGRFAATVREARDGFTSGEPENMSRGWNLELDINLAIAEFVFGFNSVGGSEIRHNENTYVWSAADSLVGGAKLRILKWWLPMELPFGTGGTQAVNKESDVLTFIPPSFPDEFYGARHPDVYAGAGDVNHLTAWPGVVLEMEENVQQGYKGLQPYRDMAEMDEKEPGKFSLPFKSPFFLVGVTKPLGNLHDIAGNFDISSNPKKHTLKTNEEWKSFDRMGAVAKSELYFSRPTDLSYFTRSDGREEKPNVFSPFWQARLVDTSNFDRFLSLALQQKIIWLREKDKHMIGADFVERILKLVDELLDAFTSAFNWLINLIL